MPNWQPNWQDVRWLQKLEFTFGGTPTSARPGDLPPANAPEGKLARWEDYQARTGGEGWDYQRRKGWSITWVFQGAASDPLVRDLQNAGIGVEYNNDWSSRAEHMTQQGALVTRDDFDMWVFHMDDALAEFLEQLAQGVRARLDYSPASLDVLEEWLLERYPNPSAFMQPSESRVLDGAARYIGETCRKKAGGHWTIDLQDQKNAYFGLPVLTGYRSPAAPISLATASTHRRTGSYLRTVLENIKAEAH